MNKRALLASIIAELRGEIDVMVAAARATHAGATHEEARPENDKDTRAIEASYLAGAQAERVAEMRMAVAGLEALPLREFGPADAIMASAIVTVDVDEQRLCFFLAPHGGGRRHEIDGRSVQAITPSSPVGRALLGRRVGDVVDVELARKRRAYEIVAVE